MEPNVQLRMTKKLFFNTETHTQCNGQQFKLSRIFGLFSQRYGYCNLMTFLGEFLTAIQSISISNLSSMKTFYLRQNYIINIKFVNQSCINFEYSHSSCKKISDTLCYGLAWYPFSFYLSFLPLYVYPMCIRIKSVNSVWF